jgi:hypothetical protein
MAVYSLQNGVVVQPDVLSGHRTALANESAAP